MKGNDMDSMEKKKAVKDFIKSLKGQTFHLSFIKKNGELRVASGKEKVYSALKGGKSTLENAPVVEYYDTNCQGYRSFRVDQLVRIKCGDKVFE
jgi:hypothetical protein